MTESFDVVIIGAGISGISAAYRIRERNPGLTYAILERRERIGGTWDLFRYPGIRSDSSIFTLSFPWEPWTRREAIADGDHIRDYMIDTARKHGIYEHIRFDSHVRSADWDSSTDTWTVSVDGGTDVPRPLRVLRDRLLQLRRGLHPRLSRHRAVRGRRSIHPQHWPEDFDYTGKTMVVIGSGATAVTLVPSLAERAGKVIMLQRTPSYIGIVSAVQRVDRPPAKSVAARVSHAIMRFRHALSGSDWLVLVAQDAGLMKYLFRRMQTKRLPAGYDRRHPLQPAVPTVGPADLPGRGRRPVRGDQRRPRRGRHRPHRPLRRHRRRAEIWPARRRRHRRHRDRPAVAGAGWSRD